MPYSHAMAHLLLPAADYCFRCGLTLTPKELDKLWATLNIATDGMYSYSTLIQHFVKFRAPKDEKQPQFVYGTYYGSCRIKTFIGKHDDWSRDLTKPAD